MLFISTRTQRCRPEPAWLQCFQQIDQVFAFLFTQVFGKVVTPIQHQIGRSLSSKKFGHLLTFSICAGFFQISHFVGYCGEVRTLGDRDLHGIRFASGSTGVPAGRCKTLRSPNEPRINAAKDAGAGRTITMYPSARFPLASRITRPISSNAANEIHG